MRLAIRYTTRFRYATAVTESQNELRACPATDVDQWLVHYHVTTSPSSRVSAYQDYWGTRVDTFGVRLPHEHLDVLAEATVETTARPSSPPPTPWRAVQDVAFRDGHLEFLRRSPHVDWGAEVAASAARCRDACGDDVVEVVGAIHEHVAGFDYVTGHTDVGVSVDEVEAARAGVCQDFAHLSLAMLREVGIPSRYVSGYLFAVDDATGEAGNVDEVDVETHAWVEVAIPGWGWLALDPTNAQTVGERHVTIGRGRDYDDVAPFRGVYSGPQEHHLEVSVAMRRLAVEPLGERPDRSAAIAQQ